MSTIVVYKLNNGQEIIGKRVKASAATAGLLVEQKGPYTQAGEDCATDEVFLEDVRVIEFVPHPSGQVQVGMFPWMLSAAEATVSLKKSAIAAYVDPDRVPKQLQDAYLQNTSGLQIAGAGAIK